MKDGKFETQPKFSFGQKVVAISSEEVFEVHAIIWHENKRFMYLVKPDSVIHQCDYDGGYWEDDLQIYEEPKPKKKVTLYRYTYHCQYRGIIIQSRWSTEGWSNRQDNDPLLLIESKEIEVDDV